MLPDTLVYRPRTYFTAVFLITWFCWGLGAWMSHRPALLGWHLLPLLGGLIAPFVTSLWMMRRHRHPGLWRDFLHRLLDPRLVRLRVIALGFVLMCLSILTAIAISVLYGGDPGQFTLAENYTFDVAMAPTLLLLLMAATFEELGWRGYAFAALSQGRGRLQATLLFSGLWSLWHLPLIAVHGSYQYEVLQTHPVYALNFFLSIIPMGVIITWVCLHSRGSILTAIIFHLIINFSQEALQMTQASKTIQTAILSLFALTLILADERKLFARPTPAALADRRPA